MLIDDVMPSFDVTRVDTIVVKVPADVVYRAALDIDLIEVVRRDRLLGVPFAIRGVLGRIVRFVRRQPPRPVPPTMRLADLPAEGESLRLAEEPGRRRAARQGTTSSCLPVLGGSLRRAQRTTVRTPPEARTTARTRGRGGPMPATDVGRSDAGRARVSVRRWRRRAVARRIGARRR